MQHLHWNGQIENYIDNIKLRQFEDGAMIFKMENQGVLALLMDAHTSDDSLLALQALFLENEATLMAIGQVKAYSTIHEMKQFMEKLLLSDKCTELMSQCDGKTAVLIAYQYQEFMWWLSVGDNQLYVFNDEFNSLGQYNVNSRIFYQWTGKANSLSLKVPCYVTGTIALREGLNRIVLLTDGVLEIEERPFENPRYLEKFLAEKPLEIGFQNILELVKEKDGKDNATMIGWAYTNPFKALRPSR